MNDETSPDKETAADEPEKLDETADAEAVADSDPAAELAEENADLKDRLLRLVAEMENLRKRTEKEKHDASRYAIKSFAEDILSVADNLGRALAGFGDEARKQADEVVTNMIAGVEMTERELLNVLGRHQITRLEPMGEKFDPNYHQAMFEVENPDVPSGTVVEVVQAGYTIGDRSLRPAMVGVSKGGAKAAAQEPAPDAALAAQEAASETGAAGDQASESGEPAPPKQAPKGRKLDTSA